METGFQLQLDIRVILLSQGDFPNVHPVIRGNIFFETNTKSTIGGTMEIFFNELAENNCRSNNSGLGGAFQNSLPPFIKVIEEEKIVAC